MGWAFFGVLNAGLAILCIIGIGYLLSHLKLLEGNRFMPQINPLMIMICFPSLNIYKIGITLPLRDAESWKALSAFLLWVAIIQLCIVAYMWATKGNAAEAGLLNLLLTANNTVIMGLPIVEATFVGPGTTVALLTIVGLFVLITPFSIVAFEFDRWMSTQVHERVGSMEAEKGIQHALDQLQGQQHESASSGSQPDAMTGQAAAPEPSFQQSSRPPQETNGLLAAPHKRVSEEGGVMETAAGAASRRRLTAGFYGPSAGGGGSRSTRPGQANGPPHSCFRDMSRSLLLPEGGQAAELGVRVAPIATPHGGDQGRGGGGKGGSDGRWEEPLGFATPSSPFSKALSLDTQELSLKEASSGRYQQIALAHDGHAWSVSVAELTRPQWFRAYLEVHKDSQDRRLLQLRKRRNLPHLAAVDAPLFMDFDRLLASPFQRRPQLNPEVELQTRLSIIEDHGGHLPFYKRFVTEHAQLLGVTMIVLKNPMLLSVVVALLMSLSDLRAFLDPTSDQYVPGLGWIALTLQLLSSITVPLALFSNGVWMYGKNLRADPRKVAAIVCLKWLVLPMLAICCAKVCGLSTASGMSLALLVSTPTASTAFVLAAQYNQGTELVTLVTIIGTVFLVPLTLLWLNVPKLMHLYDYDLSNLAGTVLNQGYLDDMAAAILYQYPLAFNPQKALFAIHEKGLANKVEMRYINLFNGQSLRPWYMKINPNSTAPAMVLTGDKPRTLVQTINILHWVDEQGPGPLGGTEVDRPLVNELVDALQGWDGNLFAFANMPASAAGILGPLGAFRREVAKAEMAKAEAAGDHALAAAYKAKLAAMAKSTERDEAAIASNKKELGDLLDRAEKLLDKSKYLAGPVFSMADVVMAAILFRLGTVQQTKMWLEPRPKLSAYFTQLKARPAYKKTFGPVSSTWGQASNIIPAVVKAKLCMAFRWYA